MFQFALRRLTMRATAARQPRRRGSPTIRTRTAVARSQRQTMNLIVAECPASPANGATRSTARAIDRHRDVGRGLPEPSTRRRPGDAVGLSPLWGHERPCRAASPFTDALPPAGVAPAVTGQRPAGLSDFEQPPL